MKRTIGLMSILAVLGLGLGILYGTVFAVQKADDPKVPKAAPVNVCVCPYEQWGEDPEEPFNEYWLCMDCDQLFFVSETLPDNTLGVDCGSATPDDCVGCLSVPARLVKGQPDAAHGKHAAPAQKAAGGKSGRVDPVTWLARAKSPEAEPRKAEGKWFDVLHSSIVQFEGADRRPIKARLFLIRIPARPGRKAQLVTHGWEIDRGTVDAQVTWAEQDAMFPNRYRVTLGNVTYPVLTVKQADK